MFDPNPFLRALEGIIKDGDLVTGAKIGSTLRIRFPEGHVVSDEERRAYELMPAEYIVDQASQMLIPDEEPANPLPVVGYDAPNDTLIHVTQEWVDEVKRTISILQDNLEAAHKQITALTAPALDQSESDRLWRTIQAAASR